MIVGLVTFAAAGSGNWRLAFDDIQAGGVVVLERTKISSFGTELWVHVKTATTAPAEFGVASRGRGVIVLDEQLCRAKLMDQLKLFGIFDTDATPPAIPTPTHRTFRNLLELVADLERSPLTTHTTMESARKLREAFYLLQDVAKLLAALKVRNPDAHSADTLSSWIEVALHRCSVFPLMDTKTPGSRAIPEWTERPPMTREAAIDVARKHAHIVDYIEDWVIDAIIEASR